MKWFFGFLVGMLILVTLVFAIMSGGGGGSNMPTTTSKPLADYASTDAVTTLLIEGPINANSLHQQIKITVDNDNVTYEAITGYQGGVVMSKNFSNNINAYAAFLNAIARAGFAAGKTDPTYGNGASVCPTSNRYRMQMVAEGKTIAQYWAGSCGVDRKSYPGNLNLTVNLFQAQVPNYGTINPDFNLY